MHVDLEREPDRAVALCREAHSRLMAAVATLSDRDMARTSRLPGWTIGHVLTHLARNADAHRRRLEGTLVGEDRPKYEGGATQRAREIEAGATRPANTVIADLDVSQERLEVIFDACSERGWPGGNQSKTGTGYGPAGSAAHRLREVEMHHVDLGLGYEPSAWPDEYVAWDFAVLLTTVPERLSQPTDQRRVMAWLAGRGPLPTEVSLGAWG